ncbi:MAG: cobalamin-dependent protein, partial [Anaerolineales bacterium]|nr:cobalamin-dependent protein [Anaerolineales bacterium]
MMAIATTPYQTQNKVRIVTAASLFDGHDAAFNIMRRILQASGAEVIHLGHNRSVGEIVAAAVQEDAQAIAVTSYQGGHIEFFKYMHDLLDEQGAGDIQIFGGGGGTILPDEIEELHAYGIARLYSPDDGRFLGLQGMINDLLQQADRPTGRLDEATVNGFVQRLGVVGVNGRGGTAVTPPATLLTNRQLGQIISAIENELDRAAPIMEAVRQQLAAHPHPPVLGITGTGGAGKSSLIDELIRRFLLDFPDKRLAIVSVDPSKRRSGGAL